LRGSQVGPAKNKTENFVVMKLVRCCFVVIVVAAVAAAAAAAAACIF